MKFKKISIHEKSCFYALWDEASEDDYHYLQQWLETHCPGQYELSGIMHLIIAKPYELFFELSFPVIEHDIHN